jgi:hypothetical protein
MGGGRTSCNLEEVALPLCPALRPVKDLLEEAELVEPHQSAQVERHLSNAISRTPSVERHLSNAICRTPSVERHLSNAICQTPSVPITESNPISPARAANVRRALSNQLRLRRMLCAFSVRRILCALGRTLSVTWLVVSLGRPWAWSFRPSLRRSAVACSAESESGPPNSQRV